MKRLHPEHIFMGLIAAGMLTGLALMISGASMYWGFRIAVGTFLVAWVPALLAVVFVAMPRWWRGS
jgi:uncharacterized membrane protein (DUF485 family)